MATTDHSHASHTLPNGAPLNHEPTDVSLKGVTRIAILSYVIILVILALVYGFWKALQSYSADTRQLPPLSAVTPGKDRLPRGPLVVADEPGMLRQHRAKERELLEHYGWVDKAQGVVHVPIERAMDLLAEHPERIAPSGGAAAAPAAPAEAAPAAPATPPTPPAQH